MVKGLVGLLCELYEGAAPDEVIAFEPTLFEDLGIVRMISPTRIAGLEAVRMRMRQHATAFATDAER
jgi:cysteine desulfuration protein SufE